MHASRDSWQRPGDRWWHVVPPAVVLAQAVAWWLAAGTTAGLSAAGGGLGILVLLSTTPLLLGPVVADAPALSLMMALTFYAAKATVLAAALVALSSETVRGALHPSALGWTVAVTTVVWAAVCVIAFVRTRRLVYDLGREAP